MTNADASRIIVGDCVAEMNRLPAGSVDMIFADPPYFLQLAGELHRPNNTRVDGVEEAWDRFDDFADYDRFTEAWLGSAKRLLADDGTLWVIGSYHNIFRIGAKLQDMGFWILNDIIWRKSNPMPNFRGRRFTNAHETMIWCAPAGPKSRYRFNYAAMKALNDDLQMRSDWLLPICSGPERLRKDGRKAHPTQKPEALLHRVILASTAPDDLILDPFFGTGTTGAVAKRLGRRFIGIERDAEYAEVAHARIRAVAKAAEDSLLHTASKREATRIPFGALIEAGFIRPGEVLHGGARNQWTARVRADGHLVSADAVGSIHQVGARVQNAASCNGWTFWKLRVKNGTFVEIDVLRQKLRAAMESAA
ncbi:MAG: site-specific DNA-methyltransferase [Novosphingobium sp.]|nr:site-specific DNA-methyltransferase [Novosphingobium sp.]